MKKKKYKQKKPIKKEARKCFGGLDKCLTAAIQTSIDVGVPTTRV